MKKIANCNRRCLHRDVYRDDGFCYIHKDKPVDTFKCEDWIGTDESREKYGGPRIFKRGSCMGRFGD